MLVWGSDAFSSGSGGVNEVVEVLMEMMVTYSGGVMMVVGCGVV